jgi:Mg2+/Co2+ transporter CorB
VRELNRSFGWSLPEQGPKTLNGLILEALEDIPEAGTSFRLGEYTIEIVQAAGQTVRNARIFPPPEEATARAQGDAELGD